MRKALAAFAIVTALAGFSAAALASAAPRFAPAGSHYMQPFPFEMGG